MRAATDDDVRLHVYERFVESGRPPTVAEAADALGVAEEEVAAAYGRLEQARVIVLAPGTLNVWTANPLCAYPSPFRVHTPRGDDGGFHVAVPARPWWKSIAVT